MLTVEHPSELKSSKLSNIACTVGVFDGVHLGHQHIINKVIHEAKEHDGKSVVITFDKHPYSIVNPNIRFFSLTSPTHKLELLESLGIDICIMIKFTTDIASITAETWIREILWDSMHIKAVFLGEDSFFGKDGKGNASMLTQWGKNLGFKVIIMDLLRIEKTPVSSTLIRKLIGEGDLVSAKKFLGRYYSIFGAQVQGLGIGRKLGFPTMNFDTQNQCLPPIGVYAVWVKIVGQQPGKTLQGIANIGLRPTINPHQQSPLLEVHILSEEIPEQGKVIEVIFIEKIREELHFSGQETLKAQIEEDIKIVKKLFSSLL